MAAAALAGIAGLEDTAGSEAPGSVVEGLDTGCSGRDKAAATVGQEDLGHTGDSSAIEQVSAQYH